MGKTPDITAAQLAAIATFVVGEAIAFGWMDQPTGQLVVGIAAPLLAIAWKFADAHLRGRRAIAAAVGAWHQLPPAARADVTKIVTDELAKLPTPAPLDPNAPADPTAQTEPEPEPE